MAIEIVGFPWVSHEKWWFSHSYVNLVMTNSLLLNMAIEIVDLPIKNG